MKETVCKYRNVSERDMDLLFIEAFATDEEFVTLFLRKTDYCETDYRISQVERSKVDNGLGESDITVIIETDNRKHALLIENKIDAIAMPDQYGRYIKRGNKGVAIGEYDSFSVFIVCPEKYRETNEEAQKYDYFVSYEECRAYFLSKEDVHSVYRSQQISQAIETMKAEHKVDINDIAVDSFMKYAEYQKKHFFRLELKSKPDGRKVNGWWPEFKTAVEGMYIIHKTNFSCVDLTVFGAASSLAEYKLIEKWLQGRGRFEIRVVKTGKSAAFRIEVPEIKMGKPFELWELASLDTCFEAIQELTDLATMFAVIHNILRN